MANFAAGLAGFGLIFIVEAIKFRFIAQVNSQACFQGAAQSGVGALLLLLFTGAVLGPIGEKMVFRGVVQSGLWKYWTWVALLGSPLLFAAVHRPSVIFVDAFVMGLFFGTAYQLSGSVWPAIILHNINNALNLVCYSLIQMARLVDHVVCAMRAGSPLARGLNQPRLADLPLHRRGKKSTRPLRRCH